MKKRNRNLIITLLVILLSIQFSYSQTNKTNAKITYIANEGFLINVGDKSILIDAIFGDKKYGFCDIPDTAQISTMIEAKEQFSNIDLIAVTHGHIDHFYAPFVSDHLTNNKKGKFISCEQAIGKLAETDNYKDIETRLIEITPDSLTHQDTVINGIDVKVFRLKHGPYYVKNPETGERINRHRNVENLGFLFNINGVKIFHCGDSDPSCISDYENFCLDKENIDIAFLGRGFIWSSDCDGIDIIRDYINPKHIILMHIHHDQNKHFIDVAEQVKDDFPSVKIFEKQMGTKNYKFE
jgi:L-ascorbate metabolism protein UlaG (beta-lactamase superfamily)